MKGAFGTFRPGGKLRRYGKKGIQEQIDIPKDPKSIF